MYKKLTDYLPLIKDIEFGKWSPEKQTGDGSPEKPFQMPFVVYNDIIDELIKEVYRFEKEHPSYGLSEYHQILEKNHIRWDAQEMTDADVSRMDGQCVMALLLGAIRAERFCDGALLDFLKKGCVTKWLERLKEIDS